MTARALAARALAWARHNPFPLCFGALALAQLVPIWTIRHPPPPDLAQHLAAATIWHHYPNPAWDLARYYELSLHPNPYWGFYALLHLFAYPLGMQLANRVVLSLCQVGLPAGTAVLAPRLGRSRWLALFAFPLAWNFNFLIGFTNFCLGLALLPFALAAFDALCERPSAARLGAVWGLGCALWFCHPLPWGLFMACAGLIGLFHRGRTLRRMAVRVVAWAMPLAVAVAIALGGSGMGMGGASFRAGIKGPRTPLREALAGLPDWVWGNCPTGHEDELLALALFAAWLVLKLSARRERLTLHALRAEACFVAALAAYLILPRSLTRPIYWWGVNLRFATPVLLFAALSIAGQIAGWRRWLLVPVGACALGFVADTTWHWRVAERFAAGFDELAALPEQGARVLFVLRQPWRDPASRHFYMQNYPHIYQSERGGFNPWNFDNGFPARYRVRYPALPWNVAGFVWDDHAPYYDYVFAFQAEPSLFGRHQGEVRKVGEAGRWTLWKLPGPRRDDSPCPAYPVQCSQNPPRPPPKKK